MRIAIVFLSLVAPLLAQQDPQFEEAWDLYMRGRLTESLAAYQQVTQKNPKFAGGWYEMGLVQKDLRQFPGAVQSFTRATTINNQLAPAWAELGATQVALQKWDEAITALQNAVKLDKNNAEAFANLGYAMWQKADPDNGEKMLKQAIKLDPNLVAAYVDLGNLCMKLAKNPQGLDLLRKGFELDPLDKRAANSYTKAVVDFGSEHDKAFMTAWQNEASGKYKEAEVALVKLTAADSSDFRALALLGSVYLHQEPPKPNDAITCYLDAVEQNGKAKSADKLPPGSLAFIMEGLGIAYMKVNEWGKAEEQFKKGMTIDKENAWLPYDVALVEAAQGRGTNAVASLADACKLDAQMADEAKGDPGFDSLKTNKDFQKLLSQYGD